MEREAYLKQLEYSLRHLMCFAVDDPVRKAKMAFAIEKYMTEEAVKLSEEALIQLTGSTEETVRAFVEYLINRGLVEITEEPDH